MNTYAPKTMRDEYRAKQAAAQVAQTAALLPRLKLLAGIVNADMKNAIREHVRDAKSWHVTTTITEASYNENARRLPNVTVVIKIDRFTAQIKIYAASNRSFSSYSPLYTDQVRAKLNDYGHSAWCGLKKDDTAATDKLCRAVLASYSRQKARQSGDDTYKKNQMDLDQELSIRGRQHLSHAFSATRYAERPVTVTLPSTGLTMDRAMEVGALLDKWKKEDARD